jgi:hypothetical protein
MMDKQKEEIKAKQKARNQPRFTIEIAASQAIRTGARDVKDS